MAFEKSLDLMRLAEMAAARHKGVCLVEVSAHSTEDGQSFHGIAGSRSTASRAADLTDGFMESGLC